MRCAWKELLGILPAWLRPDVDKLGKDQLQELRLRCNAPPELTLATGVRYLDRIVSTEDIRFCVNTASQYSPWSAGTVAQGYIPAPGGHRIGLCGQAVSQNGSITGIREIHSLCIRVARDFPGVGKDAAAHVGSILILGAPGWGKTTLLRDLIRQLAEKETVTVIDERGELFPKGIPRGKRMDILTGCPKPAGLDMAVRTMTPRYIAVDEITAEAAAQAVIHAVGCGIRLLATAHATNARDLLLRPVYRPLCENRVFDRLVILHSDKSYHTERMGT